MADQSQSSYNNMASSCSVRLRRGTGHRMCEAQGCRSKTHLYSWPSSRPDKAARWTAFVNARRKDFKPDKYSKLCYRHFTNESFLNLSQYMANLVKILYLNRNTAVPTIQMTEEITSEQQMVKPTKRKRLRFTKKAKHPFLKTAIADPSSINVTTICAICKSKEHIFEWPKDFNLALKWTTFVMQHTQPGRIAPTSGVCYLHFDKSLFSNYESYHLLKEKGKPARLYLEDCACPTIVNIQEDFEATSSTRDDSSEQVLVKPESLATSSSPPADLGQNTPIAVTSRMELGDYLTSSITSTLGTPKSAIQVPGIRIFHDQMAIGNRKSSNNPIHTTLHIPTNKQSSLPFAVGHTTSTVNITNTIKMPAGTIIPIPNSGTVKHATRITTPDVRLPTTTTQVVETDTLCVNVKDEPQDIEISLPTPSSVSPLLAKADSTVNMRAPLQSANSRQVPKLIYFQPTIIPSLNIATTKICTLAQPIANVRDHHIQQSDASYKHNIPQSITNNSGSHQPIKLSHQVRSKSAISQSSKSATSQSIAALVTSPLSASQTYINKNQSKSSSKSAEGDQLSNSTKSNFSYKKQPNMNFADQLVEICDIFGGKSKYHNGLMYAHCLTALRLFPEVKYNGPLEMVLAIKKILKCYLDVDPTTAKLHCFSVNLEGDVWLDAETYLLLIIKAYNVIRSIPNKPTLEMLTTLYVHMFSDMSDLLTPLHSNQLSLRKSLYTHTKVANILRSPDIESPAKDISTRSSQTDGEVDLCYSQEQLSHPSAVQRIAGIIRQNNYLNFVFWEAYNKDSQSVLDDVPFILDGISRVSKNVHIETETPSVPVRRLKPIRSDSQANLHIDCLPETYDKDIHLDFVSENNLELFYFHEPKVLSEKEHAGSSSTGAAVNKADERRSSTTNYSPNNDDTNIIDNYHCEEDGGIYVYTSEDVNGELSLETEMKSKLEESIEVCGEESGENIIGVENSLEASVENIVENSLEASVETIVDESFEDNCDKNLEDNVECEPKPSSTELQNTVTKAQQKKKRHKRSAFAKNKFRKRRQKCQLCRKTFYYTESSERLCCNVCITPGETYSCPVCPFQCHTFAGAKHHIQTGHGGLDGLYKCDVCDELLPDMANLKTHRLIHGHGKPYKCKVCGKGFAETCGLNGHMKVHATAPKLHQCEHCGITFYNSRKFKDHSCDVLNRISDTSNHKDPPAKPRATASAKRRATASGGGTKEKCHRRQLETNVNVDEVTSNIYEESVQIGKEGLLEVDSEKSREDKSFNAVIQGIPT